MSVLNYPGHMVYEIYTNHGYIYVSENKTTQKVEVIDVARRDKDIDFPKHAKEQSKEIFVSVMQ